MLRIVFMGTPEFAVPSLSALFHVPEFKVVGVYTQPDRPVGRGLEMRPSPVKVQALKYQIPVFQPEKLYHPGEFERLQNLNPDVIVVVAYGQILKKNVLSLPRLGCVNVHSSLLPRWRGAAPIQWAILAGDQESGVSTMHLVEKLDAGGVLLQSKTPIGSEDTAQTLHDRLAQMGADLIVPTIQGLASGILQAQIQDETQVTYAAKLNKEMEKLNPSDGAQVLDRQVRALSPWPGTSVEIGGMRLKIKKARIRSDISGPLGKIFEKFGMVLLGTSEGSLELLVVQWDGKKEVDAAGFLNGLRGKGQELPLSIG